MAPLVFCLTSLKSPADKDAFISGLKSLPTADRPLWAAVCLHWFHEPHLSVAALAGPGPRLQVWDYIIVFRAKVPDAAPELPESLQPYIASRWSITAEVPDALIDTLSARRAAMTETPVPELPEGWSVDNHAAIDAAKGEDDVEISLETPSRAFGADKAQSGPPLKNIVRDVGLAHPGPLVMLNLLSYFADQRPRYMNYVAAFSSTIGPMYGGQPVLLGLGGVLGWSSQSEEERGAKQEGGWEDVALIWYPTVFHFGKMLDDPVYVDLDRKHKGGVVRDNPLICCQEISLDE